MTIQALIRNFDNGSNPAVVQFRSLIERWARLSHTNLKCTLMLEAIPHENRTVEMVAGLEEQTQKKRDVHTAMKQLQHTIEQLLNLEISIEVNKEEMCYQIIAINKKHEISSVPRSYAMYGMEPRSKWQHTGFMKDAQ